MKVKELITKLNDLSPELDVLCYTEDEGLLENGHLFRLLDFTIDQKIQVSDAQKARDDNGVPTLKLGKSKYSQKHALIDITSIF